MDSCFDTNILDICIVTMHVKLLHIEVFNRNEIMEKKFRGKRYSCAPCIEMLWVLAV